MEEFLSKWQNLIIVVAVSLALAYGAYNFIFMPKINEIGGLKSSLKMIDTELNVIEGGPLLLKDLGSARAKVNNELEELSKKIPSETDTPYLINNFISVVGKGLNIDYNLIQPGGLEQEDKYKRLPLKVEFEGDYADLNLYLSQLKRLPVTIRVDSLDLNKITGTNRLSISMALSAFVVPGGAQKPPATEMGYSYTYDPFYAGRAATAEPKAESVAGLQYSGYINGREIEAVINDEVLVAGENILGFKVLKIYSNKVVLLKDSKVYELTLRENK